MYDALAKIVKMDYKCQESLLALQCMRNMLTVDDFSYIEGHVATGLDILQGENSACSEFI